MSKRQSKKAAKRLAKRQAEYVPEAHGPRSSGEGYAKGWKKPGSQNRKK